MAEFTLETGSVSSASSTVSSIASQVASIASSVSGWDTACEDFNFSGAKSSIASNISALESKITNTAKVVETVVQTHTQLQESMTFQGSGASSAETSGETSADTSTTSGTSTSGGSSSYSTSGGSTSGGGYYTTTGGGTSTSTPSTPTTETTEPSTQPEVKVIIIEIKDKVESIGQQIIDTTTLTGDSKTIMDQVTYNEAGYAMINSMYVVACGTALGVVGDTIEMTLSNGEKVTCVVGINDDNLGNNINFVVNDKWKQDGEKNIPSNIKDQSTKITNYHPDTGTSSTTSATTGATTAGSASIAGLGQIGINTSTWSTLDDNWTVATTKTNLPTYASQIQGKVSQNANSSKYGDKCLSFAETHAYALYTGNTNDSAESASNYPHGNSFTSWYSDSKEETLKKIYSEIVQGRPVVVQVNGNKAGTSRHFVTVVGFKNSVSNTQTISEKDLLIVDSWDGKVERMDQDNSRFLTSGKDCGKSYSGYYLRVLKA